MFWIGKNKINQKIIFDIKGTFICSILNRTDIKISPVFDTKKRKNLYNLNVLSNKLEEIEYKGERFKCYYA